MNNVKKLIDVAYSEVGYLEKETNNDLDSFTGNAGNKNFTKYARDCFPELQGLAWCCMFVWWCFEKAFNKIMARNLVGEKTAKCSIMKERMLANGCMQVNRPEQGDIVFFNTSSGIGHIGIVLNAEHSTFATIEGNTSRGTDNVVSNGGGVFTRTYKYDNTKIDSFIRPRYDLLKETEEIQTYNAEIIATNVNIRDGAGTENRVIGMVTKGYQFYTISEKKDGSGRKWYHFRFNGQDAWICGTYVQYIKGVG